MLNREKCCAFSAGTLSIASLGVWKMPELTYREAVRDALSRAMRDDDDVFIMGEDIAEMGGSMGVTQGMLAEFGPDRCATHRSPRWRSSGPGSAPRCGMRPVVEIMYEDFTTSRWSRSSIRRPSTGTVRRAGEGAADGRTQGGAGWSPGAQHAQQVEAWFVHVRG
jgi:pyruvate dehydrogenase E1 component beta subunit